MDLRELRLVLRRHIVVAALAFCAVVVLGFAAAFLPPKTYATGASIAVNTPVREGTTGSVQQATFLLPSVVAQAESRALRQAAAEKLPESVRRVRVRITATAEESVIRIRGRGGNPAAIAAWVNAVADELIAAQADDSPIVLSVIDVAPVVRKAVAPKQTPILVGSAVAAVIVAVFTALVADRVRSAFDTNQTVRDRVGTTVLGELPVIRSLRNGRRPVTALLEEGKPAELIDAFEGIRTNLAFRLLEAKPAAVAVLSYDAGAGKSTVTAGLGWSLAGMGREVVLVDADLRRPTLHERLGLKPRHGLGDMAAGTTDIPYVQETSRPGLSFVSAGLPSGRVADVVEAALPKAIDYLSGPDKLVLIDAPPLGGVAEASFVARTAGYVVLVVDRSMVELNHLPLAVARLQEVGAVLLGVVVNRVPRRKFRKQSKYGVSYSSSYRKAYSARRGGRPLTPESVLEADDDTETETETDGDGDESRTARKRRSKKVGQAAE